MTAFKLVYLVVIICISRFVSAEYEVDHIKSIYLKGDVMSLACYGGDDMEKEIFDGSDYLKFPYRYPKANITKILFIRREEYTPFCRYPKLPDYLKFEQFENVNEINSSHVKLETLDTTLLRNAKNVKTFIVSHNLLTNISPNFFPNTVQIEELDVSNNNIQRFDPSALKSAKSLRKLLFSHNRMIEIGPNGFPVSTLQHLDISHNKLSMVNENAFDATFNLKHLNLSYNPIGYLEVKTFARLTKLEVLSLRRTGIISIQPGTFSQQQNLISLDLSGNRLKNLEINQVFPPGAKFCLM